LRARQPDGADLAITEALEEMLNQIVAGLSWGIHVVELEVRADLGEAEVIGIATI